MNIMNVTNSDLYLDGPLNNRAKRPAEKFYVKPGQTFNGSSYHLESMPSELERQAEGFDIGYQTPALITTGRQLTSDTLVANAADVAEYGEAGAVLTAATAYVMWGRLSWKESGVTRTVNFSVEADGTVNVGTPTGVGSAVPSGTSTIDFAAGTIALDWTSIGSIDGNIRPTVQYDYSMDPNPAPGHEVTQMASTGQAAYPVWSQAIAVDVSASDQTFDVPHQLWVGSLGDVEVTMWGDTTNTPVVFGSVPAGTLLSIHVKAVHNANTTAGNIVAGW